jgi:hypothetical protein
MWQCLWSSHASVPARAHQHFFLFNLLFSDAPCDPSTPSSEYTRYHRLQNVLVSIIHHILYIESWIKSEIIYSIHIPFFSYLRIKYTTISLLFAPSGISLSKKNKKNRMAASILEEQFDQKHIFLGALHPNLLLSTGTLTCHVVARGAWYRQLESVYYPWFVLAWPPRGCTI